MNIANGSGMSRRTALGRALEWVVGVPVGLVVANTLKGDEPVAPALPEDKARLKGSTRLHDELKSLPPDKMLARLAEMLAKAENATRGKEDDEEFPPLDASMFEFLTPNGKDDMIAQVEKTLANPVIEETRKKDLIDGLKEAKEVPYLLVYNVPIAGKERVFFAVDVRQITQPLNLLTSLASVMHTHRLAKAGVEPSPGFQELASIAAAKTLTLLANDISTKNGPDDSVANYIRQNILPETLQNTWVSVARLYKHAQQLATFNEGLREKMKNLKQKYFGPETAPAPALPEGGEDKKEAEPKKAPAPARPGFVPANNIKAIGSNHPFIMRPIAYNAALEPMHLVQAKV